MEAEDDQTMDWRRYSTFICNELWCASVTIIDDERDDLLVQIVSSLPLAQQSKNQLIWPCCNVECVGVDACGSSQCAVINYPVWPCCYEGCVGVNTCASSRRVGGVVVSSSGDGLTSNPSLQWNRSFQRRWIVRGSMKAVSAQAEVRMQMNVVDSLASVDHSSPRMISELFLRTNLLDSLPSTGLLYST